MDWLWVPLMAFIQNLVNWARGNGKTDTGQRQQARDTGGDINQAGRDINIQTAADNPRVTYNVETLEDHSTHTTIYYSEPGEGGTSDVIQADPGMSCKTLVRFKPGGEILDSSNISSITDGAAAGEFDIMFATALNPATLVVHAVGTTPSFQVAEATADSVRIKFVN